MSPTAPRQRARPPFTPGRNGKPPKQDKPEDVVLFQKWFKSVGPRTYAAQVKRAGNGNHFLVLTEGKRDPQTNELRKSITTRCPISSSSMTPPEFRPGFPRARRRASPSGCFRRGSG